jgi:hypothetical protein
MDTLAALVVAKEIKSQRGQSYNEYEKRAICGREKLSPSNNPTNNIY